MCLQYTRSLRQTLQNVFKVIPDNYFVYLYFKHKMRRSIQNVIKNIYLMSFILRNTEKMSLLHPIFFIKTFRLLCKWFKIKKKYTMSKWKSEANIFCNINFLNHKKKIEQLTQTNYGISETFYQGACGIQTHILRA